MRGLFTLVSSYYLGAYINTLFTAVSTLEINYSSVRGKPQASIGRKHEWIININEESELKFKDFRAVNQFFKNIKLVILIKIPAQALLKEKGCVFDEE